MRLPKTNRTVDQQWIVRRSRRRRNRHARAKRVTAAVTDNKTVKREAAIQIHRRTQRRSGGRHRDNRRRDDRRGGNRFARLLMAALEHDPTRQIACLLQRFQYHVLVMVVQPVTEHVIRYAKNQLFLRHPNRYDARKPAVIRVGIRRCLQFF